MRSQLLILFLFIVLASCIGSGNKKINPSDGVVYEVFVRSFADSDGDSIGDINGLTSRLDYLRDLGVKSLWLMPVMPSPSYHKYDVTDYTGIDPEYGTMEDFRRLVGEAHRRNMRIIIDLVVNHTSSQHPWFAEASKGPDNPYRDYYVWARRDSVRDQISRKTITLDSDNITQWHPVNGDTTSEQYYGFFWGGMPDLNMDNPRVLQEFVNIGRFWLDSVKVDGFRLDAAKHIYPGERVSANHAFWKWFRRTMKDINPDVHLVGEVWANAEEVAPYLPGIPSLFNFDMAYAIADVVRSGSDTIGLIRRYQTIQEYYRKASPDYTDAIFLRNHDQNRILSDLGDDPAAAKLAAAILFTLPGTPYIYYGEEIGMKGRKPDEHIREPFIWASDADDTLRSRWESPVYSTVETVMPLSVQMNDPDSFFGLYRKWIVLRNKDSALQHGNLEEAISGDNRILAYQRQLYGERRLIVHNLSSAGLTIDAAEFDSSFDEIALATGGASIKDGKLIMPGRSSLVLY